MVEANYKGRVITYNGKSWVYSNGDEISELDKCERCGKPSTSEGYDNCLGKLEVVKNACCGHGFIEHAYIQFEDDSIIRGEDVINYLNKR